MKHYLIDSENVGDFWIPLLELPADRAELIVFYTKNSPHMSYDSLIKLKESDRKVTFIKCYEGTNALDFQLCSELGFLIAVNPGHGIRRGGEVLETKRVFRKEDCR